MSKNSNGKTQSLADRKKAEILRMIKNLEKEKIIDKFRILDNIPLGVFVQIEVINRFLELNFIFLIENPESYGYSTSSRKAVFLIGINRDIDLKKTIMGYIESIKKGLNTERLFTLSLKELEDEGKILVFKKTQAREDIKKRDFVITIINDSGSPGEILLQVKSSYLALMAEYDTLTKNGIAGCFYEPTGNDKEDVKKIKNKLMKIVEAYIKGEIIYV